jgi:hypothetical protein
MLSEEYSVHEKFMRRADFFFLRRTDEVFHGFGYGDSPNK